MYGRYDSIEMVEGIICVIGLIIARLLPVFYESSNDVAARILLLILIIFGMTIFVAEVIRRKTVSDYNDLFGKDYGSSLKKWLRPWGRGPQLQPETYAEVQRNVDEALRRLTEKAKKAGYCRDKRRATLALRRACDLARAEGFKDSY